MVDIKRPIRKSTVRMVLGFAKSTAAGQGSGRSMSGNRRSKSVRSKSRTRRYSRR